MRRAVLPILLLVMTACAGDSPQTQASPSPSLQTAQQVASIVAQYRPAIMASLQERIDNECPATFKCFETQASLDNWTETAAEANKLGDEIKSIDSTPDIATLLEDTIKAIDAAVTATADLTACFERNAGEDREACSAEESAAGEAMAQTSSPGELHRVMLAWEPYI